MRLIQQYEGRYAIAILVKWTRNCYILLKMGNICCDCNKDLDEPLEVSRGKEPTNTGRNLLSQKEPTSYAKRPDQVPHRSHLKVNPEPDRAKRNSNGKENEIKPGSTKSSQSHPMDVETKSYFRPLSSEQEHFIASKGYNQSKSQGKSIESIVNSAIQALSLNLLDQSRKLYSLGVGLLEASKTKYSLQSIKQLLLFMHLEMYNIWVEKNSFEEGASEFKQCLRIYETMQESRVEEKVVFLSNFAVFCRKSHRLDQAVEVSRLAYRLQERYFTIHDKRKYMTLVNLACFYYEQGDTAQANLTTDSILNSCPSQLSEVRQLALRNKRHYLS